MAVCVVDHFQSIQVSYNDADQLRIRAFGDIQVSARTARDTRETVEVCRMVQSVKIFFNLLCQTEFQHDGYTGQTSSGCGKTFCIEKKRKNRYNHYKDKNGVFQDF